MWNVTECANEALLSIGKLHNPFFVASIDTVSYRCALRSDNPPFSRALSGATGTGLYSHAQTSAHFIHIYWPYQNFKKDILNKYQNSIDNTAKFLVNSCIINTSQFMNYFIKILVLSCTTSSMIIVSLLLIIDFAKISNIFNF